MNIQLQKLARDILKNGLAKCTTRQRIVFRKMYASGNTSIPMKQVIDEMPAKKLDWAIQQVEATLAKNQRRNNGRSGTS